MSKFESHDEARVYEKEAIRAGLVLVGREYNGDSDFDRGMRLLQKYLFKKDKR